MEMTKQQVQDFIEELSYLVRLYDLSKDNVKIETEKLVKLGEFVESLKNIDQIDSVELQKKLEKKLDGVRSSILSLSSSTELAKIEKVIKDIRGITKAKGALWAFAGVGFLSGCVVASALLFALLQQSISSRYDEKLHEMVRYDDMAKSLKSHEIELTQSNGGTYIAVPAESLKNGLDSVFVNQRGEGVIVLKD